MEFLRALASKALIAIQRGAANVVNWALFASADGAHDPERILVLRVAALGDFIISVPALAALRRRFPRARITLLTTSSTDAGMRHRVSQYAGETPDWFSLVVPSIADEVICWRASRLKDVVAELRPRIALVNPDAAFVFIDVGAQLLGVLKKMLFLRLVGVRCAVFGWRRRASFLLLSLGSDFNAMFPHHVEGLIRGIREHPAFDKPPDPAIEFPLAIPTEAANWARDQWESRKWGRQSIIAIAPGSIQPHKRWPVEKFAAICTNLVTLPNIHIVILGTAADAALGESLAQAHPGQITNLAGQTSISQSAAMLKRCKILVGNDGGAVHLAAAVGCRVVSIIPGIELPGAVDPWANSQFSVRHSVPCSPCLSFTFCPLGHNQCMKDLSETRVLEACVRALSDRQTAQE